MRTFRGIAVSFLALAILGLLAGSARAGTMPETVSLVGQPYSASWPDSPGFTARLKVESGPQGADFGFELKPTAWSDTTYGIVYRDGQATHDGPGELTSTRIGPGGPWSQPGMCVRGSGPIPVYRNRLTLPPDSEATVEVPVSLNASPLAGMNSALGFSYFADSPKPSSMVEAPVEVLGIKGVDVDFGIGDAATKNAEIWNGKPFRLEGGTSPSLSDTEILIKAEPFAAPLGATPPVRWIRVVTDSTGSFVSKELKFGLSAFWRLSAYPGSSPTRDGEPSCGPVLQTRHDSWRAGYADLTGSSFRSDSVKGTKLVGQKSIRMSFESSLVDHDLDPKTPSRWSYKLIASAGCNTLGGRYWLKDGMLIWSRNLAGTKMACRKPVDQWLKRTLRKGLSARIVKGDLVLTGQRQIKIVLRRI